jgi:hypothetical protein
MVLPEAHVADDTASTRNPARAFCSMHNMLDAFTSRLDVRVTRSPSTALCVLASVLLASERFEFVPTVTPMLAL